MKDTYNYPEQAETSDCICIIMVMILVYGNFLQFQKMIDTCLSVVYMYLLKNRIIIHMISENYFTYTKYRRQKCATLYYYGITWFTSKNLTYVLSYWNFYKTPEDVKRFTVPVFFHCYIYVPVYWQEPVLCSGGHTADPEVPPGPGDVCDRGGRRELYVLDLSPAEVRGHGAGRPQPQRGQCQVIFVVNLGGRSYRLKI